MPVPVRAFTCAYGCGRPSLISKKRMSVHEGRCRLNPVAKCCPTCELNDYEAPEPEVGLDGGWLCLDDRLPADKVMAFDCPHWVDSKGLQP